MKIQYCSDLHLEFPENKEYLLKNPIDPQADILILAGDIMPFATMDRHQDFLDYISERFKLIYWLPGNHEYYQSDINIRSGILNEKIRENVFLVNNCTKEVSGIYLIFSTLWSHISPEQQFSIQRGMSDFKIIKDHDRLFNTEHYNLLHQQSLQFIKEAVVKLKNEKKVVVTHHVPTSLNYPQQYVNSPINDGFRTNLTDYIEKSGVSYWLYGHHHCNIGDFQIGTTQLLTNQLGYVHHFEHREFNPKATFQI
jgi:predicted phosphohydrolase